MIRVRKPRTPPEVLSTSGRIARRKLCRAYVQGHRRFEFDKGIYGHATVKAALKKAQHGKCCFCEAKLGHIQYGDVEHFRPKAGYRQRTRDSLSLPGYYWLAYEWRNLFLCCRWCNHYKGNLFPLAGSAQRARNLRRAVGREKPLFIDPARDDPCSFIGFRDEVAYAFGNHRKGQTTIKSLQLNRVELQEDRREHLARLKLLIENRNLIARLIEAPPPDFPMEELHRKRKENDVLWRQYQQDSAEYASMARAFLSRWGG